MRLIASLLVLAACGDERTPPAPAAAPATARWPILTASSGEPAAAMDGDATTGWRPAGDGPGEWLRVELERPTAIAGLLLTTSRIASARVVFSDRSELDLTFPPGTQGSVRFASPARVTRTIELIIDAVHPGPSEVAVAELQIDPR
jgi:hypothetical protein